MELAHQEREPLATELLQHLAGLRQDIARKLLRPAPDRVQERFSVVSQLVIHRDDQVVALELVRGRILEQLDDLAVPCVMDVVDRDLFEYREVELVMLEEERHEIILRRTPARFLHRTGL